MPIIVGKRIIGKPRPTNAAHDSQCKKPKGWLGRFVLRRMNSHHSKVTDWGLLHVFVRPSDIVLDVGCGGGRTVNKLAALSTQGKVHGVDYSSESVGMACKVNRECIEQGRAEIREASVLSLPFPNDMFDLVTAVETHFWWSDLPASVREVFRVVKSGGTFVIIAEVYKGASSRIAEISEKYLPLTGMKLLTVDEHRELLLNSGFSDVHIDAQPEKGWICATGKKPAKS